MDRKEFWSWVVFGFAVLVILWLGVFQPAHAHDLWGNGEPIPPGIKAACCSQADAHRMRPDQVHLTPEGWVVDGYRKKLPLGSEQPSPDGQYWIFYKQWEDGTQSSAYCWFAPITGM